MPWEENSIPPCSPGGNASGSPTWRRGCSTRLLTCSDSTAESTKPAIELARALQWDTNSNHLLRPLNRRFFRDDDQDVVDRVKALFGKVSVQISCDFPGKGGTDHIHFPRKSSAARSYEEKCRARVYKLGANRNCFRFIGPHKKDRSPRLNTRVKITRCGRPEPLFSSRLIYITVRCKITTRGESEELESLFG